MGSQGVARIIILLLSLYCIVCPNMDIYIYIKCSVRVLVNHMFMFSEQLSTSLKSASI